MQYWPRKRAKRAYPRIRNYPKQDEPKVIGFAGYKVGMTHAVIVDNKKSSMTKGEEIVLPVSIIECPPLKAISIKLYKKSGKGLKAEGEIFSPEDKALARRLRLPKKDAKAKIDNIKPEEYDDIRLQVCTQPGLTSLGKKKPEVFEIAIGGNDTKAKLEYAKQSLGKEIKVGDALKSGQQVDIHAVTKGKGFQGPVKRFGVTLRSHKSEKGVRGPGNVGPWTGNRSWTVAHAGQMGYHSRMQRNGWIVKISENAEGINPKGGVLRYGLVKNPYMLIRGSVGGASKRLVRITPASRPDRTIPEEGPAVSSTDTSSRQ